MCHVRVCQGCPLIPRPTRLSSPIPCQTFHHPKISFPDPRPIPIRLMPKLTSTKIPATPHLLHTGQIREHDRPLLSMAYTLGEVWTRSRISSPFLMICRIQEFLRTMHSRTRYHPPSRAAHKCRFGKNRISPANYKNSETH